MTRTLELHVGDDLASVFERAVSAVRRAEAGEDVQERHVSFETWETMAVILNSRRLAILRLFHRGGTADPDALAAAVGARRNEIIEDLKALKDAGLLDEDDEGRLVADYDQIRTVIAL